jgi:hypothetical protein
VNIVLRLCYDVLVRKRPGGTKRLSISLPAEDVKVLERRAKRLYDGNVSRVISEAIRYIAYEEGRDALIESFGDIGKLTPARAAEIDAQLGFLPMKKQKK